MYVFIFFSECHPDQYKCSNGQCIDMSDVCNGRNDCLDYSDENICGELS